MSHFEGGQAGSRALCGDCADTICRRNECRIQVTKLGKILSDDMDTTV